MTISLTTKNLNKRKTFFIFDYPLMHFQQNVVQFGKDICYNLTDLKILIKKNGTWAKGSGIIFPKIHWLTTSNCWKENEKVYNIQNNFDTKKLNNLIKLQSAIQWYYNEKRLQNIFTSWMSFQLLLQPRFYNLL